MGTRRFLSLDEQRHHFAKYTPAASPEAHRGLVSLGILLHLIGIHLKVTLANGITEMYYII
jgi:hypothetical protein